MGDEFFDADAHDPNHWRFYGLAAFQEECAAVMVAMAGTSRVMTVGEVREKALSNLRDRRFPPTQKDTP